MKRIIQSAVAVAAVCLLAGCETTGLSPRESSGVSYPGYILSLQTSATNGPKPVVAPIRLAVAQVGEDAPPDTMLNQLAGQKTLVASVMGMPLPGAQAQINYPYDYQQNQPTEDYAGRIEALRGLARSSGADYLFLFGGTIDSWEKHNASMILDWTLVGGLVAPDTRINIEGKSAGALIDVATGAPVFFISAEARDSQLSPDYLSEGKTTAMSARVRDELVGKLSDQLLEKLAAANASALTQTNR